MYRRFIETCFRLLLLLLIYEVSRLIFLIANYSFFQPIEWRQVFRSFLFGLRFDYTVIYYLNLPWLVLILLPNIIWQNKWFRIFYKSTFILLNSVLIILNLQDAEYFKFINTRSGYDVFIGLFEGADILVNIPQFINTYWYLAIAAVAIILFMVKTYGLSHVKFRERNIKWYYLAILILLFHGVSFSLARGFQMKPLRIVSAVEYVEPKYAPLLLNTPFTMLNTLNELDEKDMSFFPKEELANYFSPIREIKTGEEFKGKNVVIIIVESFGEEYIGALTGRKGYTPFFDSLLQHSYYSTNGIANSRRSMDAMPSILSSLPTLTEKSMISSKYSVNRVNSLAGFLKGKGYSTMFFHGGRNGTMGFDSFCKTIAIDEYIGMDEYPYPEEHYDGAWGITDEEFLQFTVDKLNKSKKPFFATAFTLSSHHPYYIPEKHKGKFKGGPLQIHASIEYADYALNQFFTTVSQSDWFKNTVFVICADHTSYSEFPEYKNSVGFFKIPIAFYAPGDTSLAGVTDKTIQQIDIFPSVLEYLNYDTTLVAYGKSVFDTTSTSFCVNNLSSNFLYIDDSLSIRFAEGNINAAYYYREDKLLKTNLLGDSSDSFITNTNALKGFIQDYYSRLVENRFYTVD